jgi:hypothetical protein
MKLVTLMRMNAFERFIEEHIDEPWDLGELSKNPSVSMDFVEKHIDEGWHWGKWGLSLNPSVTMEFLE